MNSRTSIPATLHLPVPGIVRHPHHLRDLVTYSCSVAGWAFTDRGPLHISKLSVPLDGHPGNVLSLARAVWGPGAPPLVMLNCVDWQPDNGTWWQLTADHYPGAPEDEDGGTYAGHPIEGMGDVTVIPALEGITDPLEALAIIATAVLGGAS